MPPIKVGADVKTFALKNRASLIEANRRLINDSEFYKDVRRDYSK